MDQYDEELLGVTNEDQGEPQEEQTPASQSEEQSEESSQTREESGDKGVTEKGTKEATEPQSRYYQTLKNENADMRRILSDPAALKEYIRQFEGTQTPKQGEEDDLSDIAEKVLDEKGQVDLMKLTRYMDERTIKKIDEGVKFALGNWSRSYELGQRYQGDLGEIRASHPELDPEKKESFDPELDKLIGERFLAQGGQQGKVRLKDVVEQTYHDIGKWKASGQKQAETDIRRKRAGAIPNPKAQGQPQESEEEEMDANAVLASRVRKAVAG